MMGLLTNRNAARSAARAKFKIDVQNACPPTASTLPLIGRTTAGPAGSSPTKTTPIDGARERGTTTAIGPSCRLARCTKVVRYLRYCRRAGRTAVIAVLDPDGTSPFAPVLVRNSRFAPVGKSDFQRFYWDFWPLADASGQVGAGSLSPSP